MAPFQLRQERVIIDAEEYVGDEELFLDESTPSDSEVSTDPDSEELNDTMTSVILSEIARGTYTCLVCTCEIDSDSQVWSCEHCYRVYDLDCINRWAMKGSSTDADRSWRCPACNEKHSTIPKKYTCWCGKVINPSKNRFQPHSCGQTCGSPLSTCVHGCSFGCHPGPHVEKCLAMGPVMSCHCGANETQVPCPLTPYGTGWSCDLVCGDIMPCGLHKCTEKCHSGSCGECNEQVNAICYCGKHTAVMDCKDRNFAKSFLEGNGFVGSFHCEESCGLPLDCKNHFCDLGCHPQTKTGHKCPLSPEIHDTCFCGKKTCQQVLGTKRKSCMDPTPSCGQVCGMSLDCGHLCPWVCHEGPCPSCVQNIDTKCLCHYSQFTVPCKFLQDGGLPRCKHKCQAFMNCRRHRCLSLCCEFEPVGMQRERDWKKGIRRMAVNDSRDVMSIEAKHVCTRECGKVLSCGLHDCKMTCHLGPCPPCLESSSEDLVCNCGSTVVEAPVRCGTRLPPCEEQCMRPVACGHRREVHNCHDNNVSCPNCTAIVKKTCQCERKITVPALCYQEVVRCGRSCNRHLSCGLHKCTKSCHPLGQCGPCKSVCGQPKSCGHACLLQCHEGKPCSEIFPCNETVIVTCDCQRQSKKVTCSQRRDVILTCDEDCLRAERNRKLFEALRLGSSDDLLTQTLAVENPYSDSILQIYNNQPRWCIQIEDIFQRLARGEIERDTFRFSPMKSIQRKFIHELASVYKLFSQSQDPEPHRSVFVMRKDTSALPKMNLADTACMTQKAKEKDVTQKGETQLEQPNAIIIKDVFFGVQETSLLECLQPLVEASSIEMGYSLHRISDSIFIVCFESESSELTNMVQVFEEALKKASLAFTCKVGNSDPETCSMLRGDIA